MMGKELALQSFVSLEIKRVVILGKKLGRTKNKQKIILNTVQYNLYSKLSCNRYFANQNLSTSKQLFVSDMKEPNAVPLKEKTTIFHEISGECTPAATEMSPTV